MHFLHGDIMTDKEVKQFYNSKDWKQKRISILKRDKHECQDCIERLKYAKENDIKLNATDREIRHAEQVHHIKELKDCPDMALDDDNLISLCNICHNARHGRYLPGYYTKQKPRLNEEKW